MDAATIEETNRIRVSLGMKPLPVPGATAEPERQSSDSDEEPASTVETRQAQAYDNYKKVQDADAAKRRREEKAAAVRKAREKAQRFALLEGKGFGDEEEGGDAGAKAWLQGQKKRQKQIAKTRKLEEELAAAEAEAAAAIQYTSKDLAGIRVAHDTSAFLDGDEKVLTLKDTTIDENEEEGDELENADLRDHEKLTERLDLKKKRPGYNPHDDDEEGEGGILAQYDEEIEGKKRKKFTLDADGTLAELSDILNEPAPRTKKVQMVGLDDTIGKLRRLARFCTNMLLTLWSPGDAPPSGDYLDASEVKIKKPKRKKSKHTRQKPQDDDDIFPLDNGVADNDVMETDSKEPAATKKRKVTDDSFVDDEDLQASLAISRKTALKKRKRTRPEDIARQLKEQEDDADEGTGESQQGGLVIGEISEFVAGLNKPDEEERRKPRQSRSTTKTPAPDDEDQVMKDEPDNDAARTAWPPEQELTEEPAEEEEKAVGQGMGAALALLRERGLIEESHGDEHYETLRNREEFLSKKRILQEELDEDARKQRERDRASGRLDRMSTQNREEYARQQNTWRDHQQSKRVAELFSAGYKPNVNIQYKDEFGRALDQKEAFKHLSHQFHGKGSGKGKTEKRLKKIADEKRREGQSMFDASQNGGMSQATAQQLKKRKEAGVRLG
jgi:U4/U6.U5 tri-snRNP-associated protein 1